MCKPVGAPSEELIVNEAQELCCELEDMSDVHREPLTPKATGEVDVICKWTVAQATGIRADRLIV